MMENSTVRLVWMCITLMFVSSIGGCQVYWYNDVQHRGHLAEEVRKAVEAGAEPVAASCAIKDRAFDNLMLVDLAKR
jgi:hypothetical protein